MSVPVISDPSDPLYVPPVTGPSDPSAPSGPTGPLDSMGTSDGEIPFTSTLFTIDLPQPKVGLLAFLELLSENALDHKHTTSDAQAEILVINREFYLGLALSAVNLVKLRQVLTQYYRDRDQAISTQNFSISDLNTSSASFNTAAAQTNNLIAAVNQARNTLNATPTTPVGPFNAAVAAYNTAASNLNTYLSSTMNPRIASYNTAAQTYNTQTAANQEEVDEINEKILETNEELQLQLSLVSLAPAPATAPVGTTTRPNAGAYPGVGTVPNVPAYPGALVVAIATVPSVPVPPTANLVADLDAAVALQMASLKLLNLVFQNISSYNAFLAFTLKSGVELSPAALAAFITNNENPGLGGSAPTSQGGSVTLGSSVLGLSSPLLEGALANSAYAANTQQFNDADAQAFVDALTLLSAEVLIQNGQEASFAVLTRLGAAAEGINDEALASLVAVLFLNALLDIIQNSGEALTPAVEALLSQTLNIPPDQLPELLSAISTAQNLELALFGALAVGISAGDPSFVGSLLSSIDAISDVTSSLPLQPLPTPSQALADNANQVLLKASLEASDERAALLNEAVNQAIAESDEAVTAEEFGATLERNLVAATLT